MPPKKAVGWDLRTHLWLFLLSAVAACEGSLAAQTEPIWLGKHQAHPTRILARYSDGATLRSSAVTLQSLGLAVSKQFQLVPGLVVLEPDPAGRARQVMGAGGEAAPAARLLDHIHALEETGFFEYVQPSYVYTNLLVPNDGRFTDNTLWGLRNSGALGGVQGADIGAVKAWDLTTGSTNVIVAVVDSGIRYTHQELVKQMWRNPGEIEGNGIDDDRDGYVDNVFGINAASRSGNPFDDNDHGTHVAGVIGAGANDGYPHVGVAWNVRLMACKFLEADGFGMTEDAIDAIDFAVRKGAKVINASWAGGPFERALLDSLTAARRQGVLFVAAAGNDFNDNDSSPVYPASYRLDNVITVAAMDRHDRLTSFSNFGRKSVHVSAPGEGIFSCTAASNSSYDTYSGTSMAAPYVSGVAALLLAQFPNASVPELRERLLSTAVRIPALSQKISTGGRVNAYLALSATPDGVLEVGLDPPEDSDLSPRRPVPFYVTVTDLVGVTNATVRARIQGAEEDVLFANDGAGRDFAANDEVYTAELTLPTIPGPFEIVFTISAPGKAGFERALSYNIAAPPINDHFADALDLPAEGASLQTTNRFATIEAGEPKHAQSPGASASVWWNWTPAQSSRVIVDTAGSTFDTVLAVYTNNTLRTLREVASADDAGNRKQGYVLFDATAGVTYRIAVAGFSAADAGTIRLRVEPGGGPDRSAPQIVITSPATGLVVTNANDPKLLVTGTAFDPAPNVTGVRRIQVQVNRDLASTAVGTTNWSSTVLLHEGQNRIKVMATDYAGNSSPTRSITVIYDPLISPNDFLASAIELTGSSGAVTGDNSRATKEPDEPVHAGVAGGKSIWWFYRPAADGVLSMSTANSAFDTLLALYTSSSARVGSLVPVASNDDAFSGSGYSKVSQAVKALEGYWIAVDGVAGANGAVQLDYSFTPAIVYTLTIDSAPGGATSPRAGLFEAGTSVVVTAAPDPFFAFDRWEGTLQSTDNPLSFVIQGNTRLNPHFRAFEFSDGFESGSLGKLRWTTSGNAAWTVQSTVVQAGQFAARSGPISNGQRSSLLLTDAFREGRGAFGVRVSSEATWDVLEFYLNGRRLNRWSGEIGWTQYEFAVPAGTNTLEWRYSKDFFNTSAGLDAAFLDNVDLPLLVPIDSSSPGRLEIQALPSGAMQLTVRGQREQVYLIQSCPDLKTWQTVSTNIATGGLLRWTSPPTSTLGPRTFYRAIVP